MPEREQAFLVKPIQTNYWQNGKCFSKIMGIPIRPPSPFGNCTWLFRAHAMLAGLPFR